MSISVKRLQHDVLDPTISVVTVLQKAILVANEHKDQLFLDWARRELKGYNTAQADAEYRNLNGQYVALTPDGRTLPIVWEHNDSKMKTRFLTGPVAEFDALLAGGGDRFAVTVNVDPRTLTSIDLEAGDKIGFVLTRTSLSSFLHAVRQRVLDWTMTLTAPPQIQDITAQGPVGMSLQQLLKLLFCVLDRGAGKTEDTHLFTNMSHQELVSRFIAYIDQHRHYLGYCQIEQSHALNDKGVDVLLRAEGGKVGFQLKSHFDVTEDAFAANVKRQLAESFAHGLDHYFILVCSPLIKTEKTDYSHRISHMLNELSMMKTNYHVAYGPLNTVRFFSGLPAVSRDDLLVRKAIDDDCLHEYEKGYEHLPEPTDDELREAEERLDAYGDDWPDSSEGRTAFEHLEALLHKKAGEYYVATFLPTLSPEMRQRRAALISVAQNCLAECRKCKSWDDRSEYKLPQWLDHVPEDMIPFTSLPNLLRINASLQEYLEVHRKMDEEKQEESKSAKPGP